MLSLQLSGQYNWVVATDRSQLEPSPGWRRRVGRAAHAVGTSSDRKRFAFCRSLVQSRPEQLVAPCQRRAFGSLSAGRAGLANLGDVFSRPTSPLQVPETLQAIARTPEISAQLAASIGALAAFILVSNSQEAYPVSIRVSLTDSLQRQPTCPASPFPYLYREHTFQTARGLRQGRKRPIIPSIVALGNLGATSRGGSDRRRPSPQHRRY